ncbi:MAG: hypothetical protein P8J27_02475 [Mariniblastus sp.]|nr:hypothetical protein [Mariniblastus sp.]
MSDLKNKHLIYLKGCLFLLSGITSVTLIILEKPTFKLVILLAVAIWCFCRLYYFAFYVIEHYVDREYRFAGLWDFVKYLIRRKS